MAAAAIGAPITATTATAPPTTTVIIPPLVSAATTNAESDFRTTATFVQASQLTLSLSASPERSVESSGGDTRAATQARILSRPTVRCAGAERSTFRTIS